MDDVIFEEFKGTGNMEVHLDRKLSEKRIFPAIDINKSGTRREEFIINSKRIRNSICIKKSNVNSMPVADVTEELITQMVATKNNNEFLDKMSYFLKNSK